MTRNRIAGAISALALLAAPAVAAAHGNGDDHGRHHDGRHHHKHHGKKAHSREVTGRATATIASFTDGELTLALPSGKTYTADVTDRTVIVCRSLPTTATAASHGGDGDDNSGPGKGGDDGDRRHDGDDDGPNHDVNDDHGDDHAPPSSTAPATTTAPPSTTVPPTTVPAPAGDHGRCGTDALVTGAKVSEAKLSLKGDSVIWKKIAIVK
jgi:hypothetical protein